VPQRDAQPFSCLSKENFVAADEKKKEEKTDTSKDQPKKAQAEQAQQRQRIEVDDTNALTTYANFCRVTGTPEELIIDFGLNSQTIGIPSNPVVIRQRLVTNYYTAKRLLQALHISVQRHEQAFGVLETDVQKRVVGGVPKSS
jgi:hypothetical protein